MKSFGLLFSALLALCNVCHAESTKFSEKEKIKLNNEWLSNSYSIEDIPVEKIGALLANENFERIESILSETEQKFKADIRHELELLRAYEAFSKLAERDSNYGLLTHFNKWILHSKSYIPYSAAGFYYTGLSRKARGEKYIGDTPEKNIEVAESFWTKSLSSFNKSISMNDGFLPACNGLMMVGMASGNSGLAKEAMNKALSHVPEAYYIRVNYLEFLQPKWGGTYEEADKFINASQKYGEKNPRIWSLRGTVPSMQAYQYLLDREYAAAISKYSEALKYGDRPAWMRAKAYAQYMIADYKGAIESMEQVSKYLANNEKGLALGIVELLKIEDQNKGKKGHLRPADTVDENGNSHGPLGWSDFQ